MYKNENVDKSNKCMQDMCVCVISVMFYLSSLKIPKRKTNNKMYKKIIFIIIEKYIWLINSADKEYKIRKKRRGWGKKCQ